jgi:O-antigen/teichoic acid export membrane protein
MTVVVTVQSPTTWRRSVWNVLANWASLVVGTIVSIFLSPYIVHTLGDTAYGVWVLVGSLVGYLGLLDLGTRGAVTKYVATYHAARRHEDAGRIASTALLLFGGLGLVTVVASGALALLVNHAFHVPAELVGVARTVILLSGLNVAVSLVSGVFGGIVVARQRFDALNAVNIAVTLVQTLAIVVALQAGTGLVGLALVQLAVSLLRGGAGAWLSWRIYPELPLRGRAWSLTDLRTIVSFGLSAAAIHVAGAIINYSDALVIGAFLPVAMVTFFAIASMMTDQIRVVIAGISQPLTPMVGALEGGHRSGDIGAVFLQGARFATLTVLPMVLTLEIRGSSFIGIWMGPAYAAPVGAVLTVLAVAVWAVAGFQVATATMIGINRHRGLIPVFAVEAIVNVFLSIILLSRFGIVGVAWGTVLPRLIVSLVVGPLYARRQVGVPLRTYYTMALLRPTIGMIPFALATLAIEMCWPASNLFGFFGQVVAVLPVAAAGAWFVALTSSERQAVVSLLMPLRFVRGGVS